MDDILAEWICILAWSEVWTDKERNAAVHVAEEKYVEKLCMHCCHPIIGITLQYPYRLKPDNTFVTGGQFCSWNCIKAYQRDDMSRVLSGVHQVNIRHYRKMITGLQDSVLPAPPRMTLKVFGGHLTIEEFRHPTKREEYVVNYAKLTKVIPYETHEYKFDNWYKKQEDNIITHMSTNVVNDSLKLRRPKPTVKGKSTLERSLGLNAFGSLIKQNVVS